MSTPTGSPAGSPTGSPTGSPAGTLHNRVALVTGASAGIGRAIAQDLLAHGAKVVINARRAELLRQVAAELDPSGRRIATVPGDTADDAVIASMLSAAQSAFAAPVDLVIVNAGRGLNGSVLTSDTAQWDELVRTNLLGAARLMRAAGLAMLGQVPADQTGQTGSWTAKPRDIVVIGSVVGRHVSPFSSMYGGTKFAVHGMVEGVRRELGPKGIRVSLVEPGFVVSEFQGVAGYDPAWFAGVKDRIGPVLEPIDVARAITFLAAQPASVHISDLLIRPTRQDYP